MRASKASCNSFKLPYRKLTDGSVLTGYRQDNVKEIVIEDLSMHVVSSDCIQGFLEPYLRVMMISESSHLSRGHFLPTWPIIVYSFSLPKLESQETTKLRAYQVLGSRQASEAFPRESSMSRPEAMNSQHSKSLACVLSSWHFDFARKKVSSSTSPWLMGIVMIFRCVYIL